MRSYPKEKDDDMWTWPSATNAFCLNELIENEEYWELSFSEKEKCRRMVDLEKNLNSN